MSEDPQDGIIKSIVALFAVAVGAIILIVFIGIALWGGLKHAFGH